MLALLKEGGPQKCVMVRDQAGGIPTSRAAVRCLDYVLLGCPSVFLLGGRFPLVPREKPGVR